MIGDSERRAISEARYKTTSILYAFFVKEFFGFLWVKENGSINLVTFTISNIERDRYGHYIYTIKSSQVINKNYFPSILEICADYENVVSPIACSVQWKEIPIK